MDQRENLFGQNPPVISLVVSSAGNEPSEPPLADRQNVSQTSPILAPPPVHAERLADGTNPFASDEAQATDALEEPLVSNALPLLGFSWMARLNVLFIASVVVLLSSLVLFICAQTAILSREIGSLVPPFNWIGFAALTCLWVAILIAVTKLAVSLLKLKQTPAISLAALDSLHSRSATKAIESTTYAEKQMRDFLASYPTDQRHSKLLSRAGLRVDEIEAFNSTIGRLHSENDGVSEQWLKKVRNQLIEPLNSGADQLIRQTSVQVGLKTAISPRGSLDSLIVLVHTYLLVQNLCELYGVRPRPWEIVVNCN